MSKLNREIINEGIFLSVTFISITVVLFELEFINELLMERLLISLLGVIFTVDLFLGIFFNEFGFRGITISRSTNPFFYTTRALVSVGFIYFSIVTLFGN